MMVQLVGEHGELKSAEMIKVATAEVPAPLKMVASRPTDAELAEQYRTRVCEALAPLGLLLDEMKANGFECNYQWARDARGHHFIAAIQMARVF